MGGVTAKVSPSVTGVIDQVENAAAPSTVRSVAIRIFWDDTRCDGTQTMREMDFDECIWKGKQQKQKLKNQDSEDQDTVDQDQSIRKQYNLEQNESQQNMIISITLNCNKLEFPL